MIRKRRPQKVCICGHAKSQHGKYYSASLGIQYARQCGFCFTNCPEFQQDNLRTLERLSEFAEKKST
jgi:hypothetical protein